MIRTHPLRMFSAGQTANGISTPRIARSYRAGVMSTLGCLFGSRAWDFGALVRSSWGPQKSPSFQAEMHPDSRPHVRFSCKRVFAHAGTLMAVPPDMGRGFGTTFVRSSGSNQRDRGGRDGGRGERWAGQGRVSLLTVMVRIYAFCISGCNGKGKTEWIRGGSE